MWTWRRTPAPVVPADPRLTRWRRTRLAAFACCGALGLSVLLAQAGLLGRRAARDWATFDGNAFDVVGVDAGDAIVVRDASGREQPVRLVGVDAPDLAPAPAHWSSQATQHLTQRIGGKRVTLRLEATQTRAADGALLAHVYLGDTAHLNIELLRDGHAYADRRTPHALRGQFEQAENDARAKRRGLWQAVTDEQQPPWRQAWLRELRERRKNEGGRGGASRPS